MKGHSMCPELNHLPLVSVSLRPTLYTFSKTNTQTPYCIHQTIVNLTLRLKWKCSAVKNPKPVKFQGTTSNWVLVGGSTWVWDVNIHLSKLPSIHISLVVYPQLELACCSTTRLNLACSHTQITGYGQKTKSAAFGFHCYSMCRLYSQACWNFRTALFSAHKHTTACN